MPRQANKTAGKKSVAEKPKMARPKTPSRPLPDDASAFLAALDHPLKADIEAVNKKLAKYETIKNFHICHEEFTIDGGLLTPSLKVKKKVAMERYKVEIDAMYTGVSGASGE